MKKETNLQFSFVVDAVAVAGVVDDDGVVIAVVVGSQIP